MPEAPNQVYHRVCYTPLKNEEVVTVLALVEDKKCGVCGLSVQESPLKQESLWSEVEA